MSRRGKKRALVLVAVVLFAAIAGLGAYLVREQQRAARVASARIEGLAAYADEDWLLATRRLGYCVARRINDPDVYVKYADSRWRVPEENGAHYRRAVVAANTALDQDPDNRDALLLLVDLYSTLGYMTELEARLDDLLQLDPKNRKALELMIGLRQSQNDLDSAIEVATLLSSAYPTDFDASVILPILLVEAGRSDEEVDASLDEIAANMSESMAFFMFRALLLSERGEEHRDRAVELVRQAATLTVVRTEDLELLQQVVEPLSLATPELVELADGILTTYLGVTEDDIDAERVALANAFRLGRISEARDTVSAMQADASSYSTTALGWASLIVSVSPELAEISPITSELASRDSSEAKWWIDIGSLAAAIGNKQTREAVNLIQQIATHDVETDSQDIGLPLYFQCLIDAESGEWRMAVAKLRLLSEQGWRLARRTQAQLYMRHGYPADAVNVLNGDPRTDPLLHAEARIQTAEDNPDLEQLKQETLALARELEGFVDSDPRICVLSARAYLAGGITAEALRVADAGIRSANPPTLDQAIPFLHRLAQESPDDVAALVGLFPGPVPVEYELVLGGNPNDAEALTEIATLLESRIAAATGDPRLMLQRQLVGVLGELNRESEGAAVLMDISNEFPEDAGIQREILDTGLAWTSAELIDVAIERLHAATGDAAVGWRAYSVQRAMRFNAAAAELAAATTELSQAIRGRPTDPRVLAVLAGSLAMQGDIKGAVNYLSQSVTADPSRHELLVQLVGLLLVEGDLAEADRWLDRLAGIANPSDEVRRDRAGLLSQRGRTEEAVADLQALRDAGDPDDILSLAVLHVNLGRISAAESLFEELLATEGVSDLAIATAANFYVILDGNLVRGERVLSRLDNRNTPEAMLLQAAFWESQGNFDKAETLLNRSVESRDARASEAFALFLLRRGRFEEAATICDQGGEAPDASESQRAAFEGLGEIARICDKIGGDADEVSAIVGAMSDAGNTQSLLELAHAVDRFSTTRAAGTPDYEQFIDDLERITESDPGNFAAWRMRVWALTEQNQVDQALVVAREAARFMRNDPRAAGLPVGLLMRLERWDEALSASRTWRELARADTLHADFSIAVCYAAKGDYQDALASIRSWWRSEFQSPRITYAMRVTVATILLGLDRVDEAHAVIWEPDTDEVNWPLQYLQVSEVIRDKPEVARAWISRVEPLLVESAMGRFEVGRYWFELATESGAAEDFASAARIILPLTSDEQLRGAAFSFLGICFDQLEQYADAIDAYESAIEHLPDQPALLNNLAYVLLRTGGDAQRAADLATQAILAASDWSASERANLHDTLGSALLELDRPEEALAEFQRAALSPTSGVSVLVGLAESLAAMGQSDEAREGVAEIERLQGTEPIEDQYVRVRWEGLKESVSR